MTVDPEIHRRRSIRLKGYDYGSVGAYFVTVCTKNRICFFGKVEDEEMVLNDSGRMIQTKWLELPHRFSHIRLDEFIVMPNHFHGIIIINNDENVGAPLVGAPGAGTRPAPTLGDMVGAFESITTNAYIRGVKQRRWPPFPGKLWQRNYHDRIIRDEDELNRIREYIIYNPVKWSDDEDNPKNWNVRE